jgi:hypothetical protein
MERQATRIGSVEIELRNVGTVQLRLPVSDMKQLMDFIKSISGEVRSTARGVEDPPVQVRSVGIETDSAPDTVEAPARTPAPATNSPLPGNGDVDRRREAMEGRIGTLEGKIGSLIDMNKQLIDSLNPDQGDREPRIPSAGTKYHEVLQEIFQRFGNNSFEGNQVTDEKRHVLSILNNKYNALDVVETRGRTNIYQIRKEIMQSILSNVGTSNVVEIRGKDRKSCDAFLETNQKRYPGFTYAYLEGNGLRQRYRLFFKDNSVQLSVTSNLGRFVGTKTNLIVRET